MSRIQKIFLISAIVFVAVGLLVAILKANYTVTAVQVDGNEHYTDEEIEAMVLDGKFGNSTLYYYFKYRNQSIEDIPFIEKMEVELKSTDTLVIHVYEKAVAGYVEKVEDLSKADYSRMLSDAEVYNKTLDQGVIPYLNLTGEAKEAYNKLLDVTGSGIVAYVEIPKLNTTMPIYHGTDDSVLQVAIGHIPGTSLPVGGEGTHSVISGHRGLPSAKLFTDIDKLVDGDVFLIQVLGETLTYEVDQILTVTPDDVSALAIDPSQDYVTLITCTPYSVNSHRLLVRGHRYSKRSQDSACHFRSFTS